MHSYLQKEEIPDAVGVAVCKCFRENGVYYANITFRSDDVQEVKNRVEEGSTTKTFKLECKKHKLLRRGNKSGVQRVKSPQTDRLNSTKKETSFTPLAASSPYDIFEAKQSGTSEKIDNSTKKSYLGKGGVTGREKVIQKNKPEENKKIEDSFKTPPINARSINRNSGKSLKFSSILCNLPVKRKGVESPDVEEKRNFKTACTQSSTTEVTIGTSATSLHFQEENHSPAQLLFPNKYNSQQFSYSSKRSQPKKTRFTPELELCSENRSKFETLPQSLNIHTQTSASSEVRSEMTEGRNEFMKDNDYSTGAGKVKDCFNVARSVHLPDSPVVPQVSVVLNDVQDYCCPENVNGDTNRAIQVTVNLNSAASDETC